MRLYFIVFCICLSFTHKSEAEKRTIDITNVKLDRVYDADTVYFQNPFTGGISNLYLNIKVRLYGIDTPELKTKNSCEKSLSKAAKEFVNRQLMRAKEINLENCFHGKFAGRVVCNIKYKKKTRWYDLTNELIKKGYGVPYFGKTKQKTGGEWCESNK